MSLGEVADGRPSLDPHDKRLTVEAKYGFHSMRGARCVRVASCFWLRTQF
jgi:hypothetical protein